MNVFAELIFLLLAVVAALVIPLFLTLAVGLWEKRLVWPYVPLEEEPTAPLSGPVDPSNPYAVSSASAALLQPPTEKAMRANEAAHSLGFRYLGAYRHGGGALYHVRYDAWISAEHEVLALVGGGKLASVPLDNVWLFTQLANGLMLITITSQNAAEYDLSGLTSESLVPKASFAQVVVAHLQRMNEHASPGLNYSENPLADLYQFRRAWSDDLERRGYIRFTDESRTVWKYTLLGAAKFALKSNFRGAKRMLRPTRAGQ